MFQGLKPIAICDKFISLLLIQLKAEGFRKSTGITFDLLIQTCCLDTIQFGQISVKDDLHIPYRQDPALNRELRKVVAICDILLSSLQRPLCHSTFFYAKLIIFL
jgi:hypothetical protein